MRKSGMKLLIGLLLVLLMSLLITTGLAFEPLEEEVTVYVGQKVVVWEKFISGNSYVWYQGLTDTLDTNIATAEEVPLEEAYTYKLVVTGVAKGTTAINWEYYTYSTTGSQKTNAGVIKITVKEKDPSTEPSQPTESTESTEPTEKVTLKKLKSVKLKALSAKKLQVAWKKLSKKEQGNIQKIEIQYSTDKAFKTYKTKWAKKGASSAKLSGLKKNTKYWVRIRAYKKSGNIIYVSKWVTKSKKTKKK